MNDFLLLEGSCLQHRIFVLFLNWLLWLRQSHFDDDLLVNLLYLLLCDNDVVFFEQIHKFFQRFFLKLLKTDKRLFGLITVVITEVH